MFKIYKIKIVPINHADSVTKGLLATSLLPAKIILGWGIEIPAEVKSLAEIASHMVSSALVNKLLFSQSTLTQKISCEHWV